MAVAEGFEPYFVGWSRSRNRPLAAERHHWSSRQLSVTVGKLWAKCGHGTRINWVQNDRRHGIASAHGLTIRLNPWVRALAAIRVVDARGGQAMPSFRLGSWSRLPTRYGTGTGSWLRTPRSSMRSAAPMPSESATTSPLTLSKPAAALSLWLFLANSRVWARASLKGSSSRRSPTSVRGINPRSQSTS